MTDNELRNRYERLYGPFTHMGPGDIAIWLRYLIAGGAQFAPFQYDIRVGDGVTMPPLSSRFAVKAAYALTTKRIDVLCVINGRWRIIEVKQRAGLSAIGQLIGYRDLLVRDMQLTNIPEMLLVTDQLQPDMIHLLIENNISYIEV